MGLTVDSLALTMNAVESPPSPFDLSTPAYRFFQQFAMELATGTGSDQADRIWTDKRDVTNPTPDDIDLSGTLAGVYGTVVFTRIKAMAVRHNSGTGNLTIGGSPTNPFIAWLLATGDGVVLRGTSGTQRPFFCITAPDATGFAVTGGSADVLRFASSAGVVNYSVILIGTS